MDKNEPRRLRQITELTEEFGVTTRTLRFYEDVGLLQPLREGRRRLYAPRDRARLRLILRGKRLGFSLDDIREMIEAYDAPMGEAGQIRGLIERLRARRTELEQKRRDIDETLAEIDGVEAAAQSRLNELERKAAE